MSWEDEVREAAGRYVAGREAVLERRRAWGEIADALVLATLLRAVSVLDDAGVPARAKRYEDRTNASDVDLWLLACPTGIVWHDRQGTEVRGVEHPAAMGYGQGDDGRVAHWRSGHRLDDEEPRPARVVAVYQHPREISADIVERHVLDFLREALATSFRGPGQPADRPVGFTLPRPSQ